MASTSQVGSYIFGGLFIGVWLYMALFGIPGEEFNDGAWSFWGFVGLVLAAAIYGSRLTEGGLRIALFVIIGVAVGMALTALIMEEVEEGLALLLTFVGAGLIVSALPRPESERDPTPQAMPPPSQPALPADEPAGPRRRTSR